MKTKWDVLAGLFELKEATLSRLAVKIGSSPSSTRQRLKELIKLKLATHDGLRYLPEKANSKTFNAFNIMKFCRQKGINHNILFSGELPKILQVGFNKEEPLLSDFKDLNAKTVRKYLTYLNRVNLVFVTSKKPLKVKFIRDPVFEEVLEFFGIEKIEKPEALSQVTAADYEEIQTPLRKLKTLGKNIRMTDKETEIKIEFASASTQLEGNTFTLEETKDLILHDVVPQDKKLREANEVKNYYAAVNYLFSRLEDELTMDFIIDMHRIAMHGLGVKEGVRTSRVSIKGNPFYKTAPFSEIFHRLDKLCSQVSKFVSEEHTLKEIIEFASFAHNEFQHIHPFEDGNSRITRLVWNYVLMKKGFPLINIYSNVRAEYLALTKLARQRNDVGLNAFLIKIIKDNLHKRLRAP